MIQKPVNQVQSLQPPIGWPLSEKGRISQFMKIKIRWLGNPGPPKAMIVPIGWSPLIIRPLFLKRAMQDENYSFRSHPTKKTPSKLGHSIGWFEGKSLIVRTDNFIDDPWGSHTGIDSVKKILTEKFSLSEDGLFLYAEICG